MFHTIKLSKTVIYLAKTASGYIQIDTGYGLDWECYEKKLARLNIRAAEITSLILTHHHDDHAGFVNRMVQLNAKLRVVMHEECVPLIKEGHNSKKFGGAWATGMMKSLAEFYGRFKKEWDFTFEPYQVRECDIILNANSEPLSKLTGSELEFIYTPGHTIDSISILDGKGNLFCGDAAANYMQIAGTRYAPPFITNLKQLYESWQKLIDDKRVSTIYPAHGKPFKVEKLTQNINSLSEERMGAFKWD